MDYDRIILELISRVQVLEEKVQKLEATGIASPQEVSEEIRDSKKYRPLSEAILAENGNKVTFSFSEIEEILGVSLPSSARNHRAFWANTKSHSIALSWMSIGFETTEVDMENENVTFIAKRNRGISL